MATNPFLPSPRDASAWAEGFLKGLIGGEIPQASESVDQQSIESFNQGVVAGEQSSVDGLEFADPCVSAAEGEGSEIPSLAFEGASMAAARLGGAAGMELLAHGLCGLFVLAIELAVSLPHRAEDPAIVLPKLGQQLIATLSKMGLGSLEFFVGAGVDSREHDCEIKLTPLFKTQDQALQAVKALGRAEWIVGSWRTDQSNSFKVVDGSAA